MAEIKHGHNVGTVLRATRYHRASAVADATPETDSNTAEAAMWGGAGLALVVIDARGSGASFGTCAAELSGREIADYDDTDTTAGRAGIGPVRPSARADLVPAHWRGCDRAPDVGA